MTAQDRIVAGQLEVYRDNFLRQGDTPQGTYHNDQATQYLRFERLVAPLLPFAGAGFSIHDVGAGSGELHRYLLGRGVEHAYSGSEIVPEMVEAARAKFPEADVRCRSIGEAGADERYDFVVLCGTFNQPGAVPRVEWALFIRETLRRMYAMCRLGISFNFLTSYRTFSLERLHYQDPFEIADFCVRELSRHVMVDHAMPLYEANVTVMRPECLRQSFPQPEFDKYLPRRA
jgi:SAM-dependent methyltransferase